MKKVICLGLCIVVLGLGVAIANAQQPLTRVPGIAQPAQPGQNATMPSRQFQPPANNTSPALGQPALQPVKGTEPGAMPQPSRPQDPAMASAAGATSEQPRGELGIWMVESDMPGIQIQRVTAGSAAEQAGLRTGDIILKVNGRAAGSPQAAADMIRQTAVGQTGTLTIWRDGDQQQLQFTMHAARPAAREMSQDYRVGFRGESDVANGDLASRTMRLEQQLNTVMQELRQHVAQLRAGGSQPPNLSNETPPSPPAPSTSPTPPTPPAPPSAAEPAASPPPFGETEKKTETTTTKVESTAPSAPPAGEKPAATDPFGSEPAPAKTGEQPKEESKTGTPPKEEKGSKAGEASTDDLFK
jgi:hypothetical protein